jgi:hypothetical protein
MIPSIEDVRERREKLIALGCPVHFVIRRELNSLEEIEAAVVATPELAENAAFFREYLGLGVAIVDYSAACGDKSVFFQPDQITTQKAEEASCPKCLERMEKANG